MNKIKKSLIGMLLAGSTLFSGSYNNPVYGAEKSVRINIENEYSPVPLYFYNSLGSIEVSSIVGIDREEVIKKIPGGSDLLEGKLDNTPGKKDIVQNEVDGKFLKALKEYSKDSGKDIVADIYELAEYLEEIKYEDKRESDLIKEFNVTDDIIKSYIN